MGPLLLVPLLQPTKEATTAYFIDILDDYYVSRIFNTIILFIILHKYFEFFYDATNVSG